MTRAEIYEGLSEGQKVAFLFGAMLYDDTTKNGKKPISSRRMKKYSKNELDFLFFFMDKTEEFDFETNLVACDTLYNLLEERCRRNPIEISPELDEKIRQLIADSAKQEVAEV